MCSEIVPLSFVLYNIVGTLGADITLPAVSFYHITERLFSGYLAIFLALPDGYC